MGIRRLWQDLEPYTERVILGRCHLPDLDAVQVKELVIDGPSLVYHVYNKLLAMKAAGFLSSPVAVLPTYGEINDGVIQMLQDLRDGQLCIVKIYFDGVLPASKLATRQQRLEQTRLQLQTFRLANATLEQAPNQVTKPDENPSLEPTRGFWSHSVPSTRKQTPPPPPFMVASVIETLKESSSWTNIVEIVSAEADVFCASMARNCGATILSNDSDLTMYDLGDSGSIVLLQSLSMKDSHSKDRNYIDALAIWPLVLAKRLKLPSLLPFGFERWRDLSASHAVILERAREKGRHQNAQYRDFSKEYELLPASVLESAGEALQGLDPRTAELVYQVVMLDCAESNVFLPVVLEDSLRDAAWSYGAQIRQLAYSILYGSKCSKSSIRVLISEYAKKGVGYVKSDVPILTNTDTQTGAAELETILHECLSSKSTRHSGAKHPLLSWMALSIELIRHEKYRRGKTLAEGDVLNLLQLQKQHTNLTWDILHLHACIHTTLYSLRILKQVISWWKRNGHNHGIDVRNIAQFLDSMPSISDLFPSFKQLRTQISGLGRSRMPNSIQQQLHAVQRQPTEQSPDTQTRSSASMQDNPLLDWCEASKASKARRKRKRQSSNDHAVAQVSVNIGSNNMFASLMEDEQ